MSRRKTVLNLGVVIALTVFVLVFLLYEDFDAILAVIKTSNPLYLLFALGFFCLTLCINAKILLNWLLLFKPKLKYRSIFKSNILAVFARNITPLQSGGQAMNVYAMKRFGVDVETSIFALSIDFVVFQTVQVLFSLFWILTYLYRFQDNSVLYWGVLFGFMINSGILFILYLFVLSRRLHLIMGKLGIWLLSRMRVVKNPEKTIATMNQKIDDFAEQLRYLKKHKHVMIKNGVLGVIGLMVFHSIPFLIANSLHINVGFEVYFEFIALSVFVSTTNALLPLPGGTGGLESIFMRMFGRFVSKGSLSKGFMVLWRLVTYYFMLIVGAVYFVVFTGKKQRN